MEKVAAEIEEDRETLIGILDELGYDRDTIKEVGGWMAEKFGRLKLNGQLTGYSPLSRLIEIEGLMIGVGGKLSLWENLRAGIGERIGEADLDRLIHRAQGQIADLRELRLGAAEEVFADLPAREESA